jgi:hypothetical protein
VNSASIEDVAGGTIERPENYIFPIAVLILITSIYSSEKNCIPYDRH